MERSQFKNTWDKVKNDVKKQWDKLTDADLNNIDGNVEVLKNKIGQIYGYGKSQISKELDDFLDSKNLSGSTAVGDTIRNAGAKVNEYGDALAYTSDTIVNKGQEAANQIQDGIEDNMDIVYDYIKNHPLQATLMAAGVGLMIGRVLRS